MAEKKDVEVEGLINQEKAAHAVNEPGQFSMRFQLLATLLVICMAAGGGVLGYVLYDIEANDDIISWVGLPGDLFIRALRCVVLPLVFVNVILAVIQMIEAGKAGQVGKYTVLVYLLTTFIASIEGLLSVVIFAQYFSSEEVEADATYVNFLCPTNGTTLIQSGTTLECVDSDLVEDSEADFYIDNVNGYFYTAGDSYYSYTFSETLQNGIFNKLIPENIVGEFADGGFVGVVMFGIIFGAAANNLQRKPILIIDFLEDVNDILVRIIEWIIYLTPLAVFSLIAGALASQDDLVETMKDVGYLVLASVTAILMHLGVVYPGLFYLFTKTNPYAYMRYIIPAQIFAFSCASSAATLPVTLRCVKETGQVPDSIRDFVLPIGATVNMDGTALYFPPALIFLSKTAGLSSGAAEYFLIVLVSTIGSAGAAPVPNAGLVLIITAFNTVYGGSGVPSNFAIIVGIDWLMDRFQTALNITGDSMVARIVTSLAAAEIKGDTPTSVLISQEEAEIEVEKIDGVKGGAPEVEEEAAEEIEVEEVKAEEAAVEEVKTEEAAPETTSKDVTPSENVEDKI